MINNFKYAISLAQMLHDVDINDMDTLIEIGLVAHNFIGNKNTHLVSEIVNVDPRTGLIKLPCKADLIEAITYPREEALILYMPAGTPVITNEPVVSVIA